MMHIVYLCNEYPPVPHGGIGTFVQLMGRRLVQCGHKVSVVGLYKTDNYRHEIDLGVEVHRFPGGQASKINTFYSHRKMAHCIRQLHTARPVDLIEGNELSFGLLPAGLPGRRIIRMQGGYHFFSVTLGLPMRRITRLIEKRSFSQADHFCAVSRFAAETTRQLLGLNAATIEILPNPVDTQLFRPAAEIPEQDGLIVFTGGLREKKGVRQLLQAMQRVVQSYPAARLWIHGSDTKDPRTQQPFSEILRRDIDPSLASRIEFRGVVPHEQLPEINARASVLVYPSWMETQGIVVIEGMASGKPVVASQTGPGPELIEDGQDGLLCDPYSPDSIAEKILLLLTNASLRKKLSIHARQKVQKYFSTEVLVEKNLAFYEACLSPS